ncbi:MAG: hypothetical protein JNM91_13255 [Flavobacteriales bacterium]|nr:hypothetical protein [Flavobacteriales bacterium]
MEKKRPALAMALLDHCAKLNLNEQAEDVRQFVIDAETLETVVEFPAIVRGRWLK